MILINNGSLIYKSDILEKNLPRIYKWNLCILKMDNNTGASSHITVTFYNTLLQNCVFYLIVNLKYQIIKENITFRNLVTNLFMIIAIRLLSLGEMESLTRIFPQSFMRIIVIWITFVDLQLSDEIGLDYARILNWILADGFPFISMC